MMIRLHDPDETDITIGRVLLAILLLWTAAITWSYFDRPETDNSTIGANEVSNLHCEEDEVIGFDSTQPAPYPLACIHPDSF